MVRLHELTTTRWVLHAQFKPKRFVAFHGRVFGQGVPQIPAIAKEGDLFRWVHVEILVRCQIRHVGFLNAERDKEWLIAVVFVLQPLHDLPRVLAIFMLLIPQPAATMSGGSLGVQRRHDVFHDGSPATTVLRLIDAAVLLLKLQSCGGHHRQLVVVVARLIIAPRQFSGVGFAVVKHLAHFGRPVAMLFEKLRQSDRVRSGLSNV